jgi:hypothetical protein
MSAASLARMIEQKGEEYVEGEYPFIDLFPVY